MTETITQSYLTDLEVDALQTSKLSRKTPFLIRGVSCGYFSVARHYGGAKFNGFDYTYMPTSDELVRADVVQWIEKRRRAK